jgi:CBS domain-containing protein
LRLIAAFPHSLEREYPVVRPDYPLLTVLYLLRMKDVAAVPLSGTKKVENRAVFGFSSLSKMLYQGPAKFASSLKEPCLSASDQLASVDVDQDLESLLRVFKARRLGLAMATSGRRRSMVTLADVLGLYSEGSIRTTMQLRDVSSAIVSLPGTMSMRGALKEMFSHRFRRAFIEGGRGYVSDRTIMDEVLGPKALEELDEDPHKDLLATPIGKLQSVEPIFVSAETSIKAAARHLGGEWGRCLVMGKERMVTQWDVVMKPFLAGKLIIR